MGKLILKTKAKPQSVPAESRIVSPLMNERDAAAYLCCSPRFLTMDRHKAKQSGAKPDVPFLKVGGSVRYRLTDLQAYIEAAVIGA